MHAFDRVGPELGPGIPVDVAPHLLKEDVRVAALAPVQDAIQEAHLRGIPGEPAALRLVDALLEFDPAEVQPQPIGMTINLAPGACVLGGRIAAPAAAAVGAAIHDWDGRLDGVPRRSKAAAHHVFDLAAVSRETNFGLAGRVTGRRMNAGEAGVALGLGRPSREGRRQQQQGGKDKEPTGGRDGFSHGNGSGG